MSEDNGDKTVTGWCKVYHKSGILVTLPVTEYPISYADMSRAVDQIILAGFLPTAPGLEAGEVKDEIGYVVRRSKSSRDGGQTPVVDLYPANEGAHFVVLTCYLNKPEDVAAFEFASGMTLFRIPEYIGDNKIERGKNPKTDALVTKAPKPFGVVYVANPKWSQADADSAAARKEVYGVPKRKFVRWVDERPGGAAKAAEPAKPAPQPTQPDESVVNEWQRWLVTDPSVEEINLGLPKLSAMDPPTKKAVWGAVVGHCKMAGFDFDPVRKVFVPPVDVQGAY